MLEIIPKQLEDKVVEHLREYIEDLRDEAPWTESFSRTQNSLVNTTNQAYKDISDGKAIALTIDQL